MDYDEFKVILDTPIMNPKLGFDSYINAFTSIIEQSETRFSIGIFGGWGSGKSTLMEGIQQQLNHSQCITVEFSAWRYEKEEHLIIPLLDSIREALLNWEHQNAQTKKFIQKLTHKIGGVTESLISGFSMQLGIPGALKVSFDANKALATAKSIDKEAEKSNVPRSFYLAAFQALQQAFKEFKKSEPDRKIVVFIDDLDRCLPDGALEVLESMKLFFDLPGFVFIVGLDRQVVEWCIECKYSQENLYSHNNEELSGFKVSGSEYIKKIFQLPFILPPIQIDQANEITESLINSNNFCPDQVHDLSNKVREHLPFLLNSSTVNLREIKRFINSYVLIMKINHMLNPDVVLSMQVLSFVPEWSEVYESIREHGSDIVQEIQKSINQDENCLQELSPQLASLPRSFLNYVSPTGPGKDLLTVDHLNLYINLTTSTSSIEAERTSENFHYLELLKRLANNRKLINLIKSSSIDADLSMKIEQLESLSLTKELHERSVTEINQQETIFNNHLNMLSKLRKEISELERGMIGSMEENDRRKNVSENITRHCDSMMSSLDNLRKHIVELKNTGALSH